MSYGDALLFGLGIAAALVAVFVIPPWVRTLREVVALYSKQTRHRAVDPVSGSLSMPLAGFPRTTDPEHTTATPLAPLEPEEEPTDLITTGVPVGFSVERAEAPSQNAGPQIVLRDEVLDLNRNDGLHQSAVRSLQIDDGPIVSLMTTDEDRSR